jgi:hypothetical protein
MSPRSLRVFLLQHDVVAVAVVVTLIATDGLVLAEDGVVTHLLEGVDETTSVIHRPCLELSKTAHTFCSFLKARLMSVEIWPHGA